MQPTTSNNHSLSVFPYHVYNQAGFENLFINGRGFIYLKLILKSVNLKILSYSLMNPDKFTLV